MRITVTGATGFLGGNAARRLNAAGHRVVGVGRDRVRGRALKADGIGFVRADLTDAEQARAACVGAEVVVHCAAMSEPWGRYSDFYAHNVLATEHVIAACTAVRARRLVHISTPALYVNGRDRFEVREDEPLPAHFVSDYVRTKGLSEQRVQAAGRTGLETIILRPRGLFGPGDRTILPRIVEALRARRLPRIGKGDNLADLTYIDNAALAIERAVGTGAPDTRLNGRVFNISNGERPRLWDLIDDLADHLALPRPRIALPYALAYRLGWASETGYRVLGRVGVRGEPRLTRYTVVLLGRSMTLDISAARGALGYRPEVSIETGIRRFVASLGAHAPAAGTYASSAQAKHA